MRPVEGDIGRIYQRERDTERQTDTKRGKIKKERQAQEEKEKDRQTGTKREKKGGKRERER